MTAPSNANTSGLEVVAWTNEEYLADTRARKHGAYWLWGNPASEASVALVTAASAQARIGELERALEKTASDFREAAEAHDDEKTRANRLAAALHKIASVYGVSSISVARAALQQEG